MDAEAAFRIVGNFGKYQLFLSSIFFLANLIFSLQMVLILIVGANVTEINPTNMSTIVTEFDLYDKLWTVDLSQSLFMGGYMIGCFVFSQLSDSYGRRIPVLVGGVLASITGFCTGFATSWETFAVTRFLTGTFLGGNGVIMFVILTELLGKKTWAVVGLVNQSFFSLGICFLSLLGYFIPRWQNVCFVSGALAVGLMILMILFVPESPRWLYSSGKTEKAQELLRIMAKRNGNDYEAIVLTPVSEKPTTNTYADMFRHKKLIIWILAACFMWFSNGLIYYGLTLSAATLTSDLFIGIILSGVVEIPALVVCIILMDIKWVGRKRTLWLLFGVCFLSSLIAVFTYQYADAKLVLGLASKLVISGAFNVIYVYTCEVFPTSLRTVAVGIVAIASRIGAIIAPFLSMDQSDGFVPNGYLPYLVFAICAGVSCVLLFLLPQTIGRPVPQTIDEVLKKDMFDQVVQENIQYGIQFSLPTTKNRNENSDENVSGVNYKSF